MTLIEIEKLARLYADRYDELAQAVQAIEDGVRDIKRKMLPIVRRAAERAAERKGALVAAIESSPEHFERPRTHVLEGIKVGFQKRRGQVVVEDEAATVRRIRELLPKDQAELLVRVRESVHKPAVYDLIGSDLKRLGIKIEADTDEVVCKVAGEDIERMVDALLGDDDAATEAA